MKNCAPLSRLIVVSVMLITSLACVTLLGTPDEGISIPVMPTMIDTVTPIASENLTCPAITDKIVDVNSPQFESDEESFDSGDEESDEASYLVTYIIKDETLTEPYLYDDVSSNFSDEQNDFETHKKIWNYFSTLIPHEFRPHLKEFTIFTDGESNTLAAVAQTYDDAELWGLEVDYVDITDYYYLSFTLVHEYAHLFTLAPNQVPPSLAIFNNPEDNDTYLEEISACSTYFPGEGCSKPDSYIHLFYQQFWSEIYDEWNQINLEEDEDLYYEKLDDFYYKYQDQFLTDYSATSPAEDIAESFGFFVFAEKPDDNTIAEQKILFFYQFPELVELRTEILNNLCVSFPK